MRLYHFTGHFYLPIIQEQGITIGDVPIKPNKGFCSPWLTRSPDATYQPWADGAAVYKTAIRLTVDVDNDDPRLHHWPVLASRFRVTKSLRRALARSGGRARDWYVYENRVPPERIIEVTEIRPQMPLPTGPFLAMRSSTPFGIVGQNKAFQVVITRDNDERGTVVSSKP